MTARSVAIDIQYQQQLFTHSFVCIVRKDHPSLGNEMTRKQFVEGIHGVVQATGQINNTLEAEFAAAGLRRKVHSPGR